ncbi:MAG TPA: rod shape-determining protein RodA [Victivallales bacterium]|nr:rod shape-determining protein RodA [Victivallales bacterium]HPO91585.1 rod shape-determining protein RodA [Victivallales bacterium]
MDQNLSKVENSNLALFLKRFDFLHFFVIISLSLSGVLFIYGIGQQVGGRIQDYWKMQIIWLAVGFSLWIYLSFFFDLKKLRLLAPIIFVISVLFLILVLFQGQRINMAKRWINIMGFRFQPSELAKTALVIMLAWILTLRDFNVNKLYHLLLCLIIAAIPFILICVEPDLGTAVVIIPLTFSMLFVAGLNKKWIFSGIIAMLILLPSAYPFLKEYQKERIRVFLDPNRDIRNRGWNSLQAELAVGSGGLYGKGFMQGTQHSLGFLPQTVSNTDFIFSVIGEEMGFIGSLGLVILYLSLCFSLLRTSMSADPFGKYIAVGVCILIFIHSFINIGMTIRLLPVTGLPLPLISYGGTFTINTLILLGLANSAFYNRSLVRN